MKNKQARGLSLVEILVSLIIFSLGMVAASRVFVVGKHFIKEAENKSRAMQVANLQMERFLSLSYKGLEALINFSGDGVSYQEDPTVLEAPYTNFSWQATLRKRKDVGTKTIDFIDIDVACIYKEVDIRDRPVTKEVRLLNCIPYPYVHIVEYFYDYGSNGGPTAQLGFTNLAELTFVNKVPVDLKVIYTITLLSEGSGINPTDTISTQCLLDGSVKHIMTMTPIISQSAVNNVLGIDGVAVPSGATTNHTVSLQWRLDQALPAGASVRIKKISLIVVQLET